MKKKKKKKKFVDGVNIAGVAATALEINVELMSECLRHMEIKQKGLPPAKGL